MIPIIKQNTRVLRPSEFNKLLNKSKNGHGGLDNKTNLLISLLTGMRYIELQRLRDHPEWVDIEEGFIHLPPEADRKKKRKMRGRAIKLTPRAKDTLEQYYNARRLPHTSTGWVKNLRRWAAKAGLDPAMINVKTARKTWESWLMVSFPHRAYEIINYQGHDARTSIHHYQGMAFNEQEKLFMKEYVEGW